MFASNFPPIQVEKMLILVTLQGRGLSQQPACTTTPSQPTWNRCFQLREHARRIRTRQDNLQVPGNEIKITAGDDACLVLPLPGTCVT